VLEIHYNSPLN